MLPSITTISDRTARGYMAERGNNECAVGSAEGYGGRNVKPGFQDVVFRCLTTSLARRLDP